MALQPVTATWHQADVEIMFMDGYWRVKCSLYVMRT